MKTSFESKTSNNIFGGILFLGFVIIAAIAAKVSYYNANIPEELATPTFISLNSRDKLIDRNLTNTFITIRGRNILIKNCEFYLQHMEVRVPTAIKLIEGENISINNCFFDSRNAGIDVTDFLYNETKK